MKNILIAFLISILYTNCKAQNPVIDINDQDGITQANAYYKDTHNLLQQFAGTYTYSSGNKYFKIILQKKTMSHTANQYYEDLLVGEYEYIDENGVTQMNTLSSINTNYINQHRHSIFGNGVLEKDGPPQCRECDDAEKRVDLGFLDNYAGHIVIRKITVNGQEAISVYKSTSYMPEKIEGQGTPAPSKVPDGNYILIRQN
ncbi:MAG TPA: DUF6705 family protein [Flavobacterium sp.]|nr:DUF6705 family protein [Flavobacterium sp.]